jgi:V-type H+-transporting ATPase subunit a
VSADCNCSLIYELRLYVVREKYLYTNLNMMRMQGSIFQGTFWMPTTQLRTVEQALQNLTNQSLPKG